MSKYDPRVDILALFTNSQISASDGNITDYVEVFIRERNLEEMASYKGAGIIILEEPVQGDPILMSIGDGLHKVPIIIRANLFVRLKKAMKNPDVFMKNIINSFQNTIQTNSKVLISNGYVKGKGAVNPNPQPEKALFGKTMLINCYKFE